MGHSLPCRITADKDNIPLIVTNFLTMKLNDVASSVDILLVGNPVLVKEVSSHLSIIIDKTESRQPGIQWRINDIYRDVALDLRFKLAGKSDTGISGTNSKSLKWEASSYII